MRLLDEVLERNTGQAYIPLDSHDGVDRGQIMTPLGVESHFQKYGPQLTAEQRAAFGRQSSSQSYSSDEMIRLIRQ